MPDRAKLSVFLTPQQMKELKILGAECGQSMTSIVQRWIAERLDAKKGKKVRAA